MGNEIAQYVETWLREGTIKISSIIFKENRGSV
jgi:hypothetical protein